MSDFLLFLKIFVMLFSVFITTAGLTWLIYHQALRRSWLAIPNERSSHKVPTPSGAGLAIAVVLLFNVAALGLIGVINSHLALALFGGGLMISAVSWLDGRYSLKARTRIFVHALAAIWALWWLGGFPTLDLGFKIVYLGAFGTGLAFLGIVWMSNFYNFMDGIDGLIGAEAVMVGSVLGLLLLLRGAWDIVAVAWIIAATAGGFLVWNWHPAKIFMGDVGSVLLGFSFAVLAVASENVHALPSLFWILLFAVFITDATLTTFRRMLKGERWFEAHRIFCYQLACRRGLSHSQVVVRVIALNIFLVIAAIFVLRSPVLLVPLILILFLLLSWLWWMIQFRQTKLR